MKFCSLLFVPADSEKKFAKARETGADGLILDLEDSVAPPVKAAARATLGGWIDASSGPRGWGFWVRINPFDSGLAMDDLAAVVRPGLDGILLPKSNGGQDVVRLGHCLDALEARAGMAPGHVKIIVVATETAPAMFALGSYAPAHPRLAALTWGAEDLAAVVGSTSNKDESGDWSAPYQLARSLCLMGASAAGVPALDTLYADFRDDDGLVRSCRQSRRDGFAGRLAIHPAQVAGIKRAFTPSPEDVALAHKVVAAFEANPGLGTIGIDGKMYDIPHLKLARRTLAAATEG
ncbi:HpcH/HpaI aldolase/citrate lyase family protein [Ferrovibrio sp.]|uniref:HpcH/HpaI aldolase/citrate lyase family protein n=1 Tax=Ferrovibrio sp. TaxID=1917215 RepID=UPI003D0CE2B4